MADRIVCVDGHSILNRAFYGIPELTNSAGVHTNAVYGFMNILLKILDEEKPKYLAVAFDRKEPTFRHEMFDGYKGTRKPMPQELHEQVPLIRELLVACGVPVYEKPGYEADDILGTFSRQAEARGLEVTLVSGDRDLLQLATEHTRIRIPKTKMGGTVTENYFAADVKEKYQVTPQQFIDVKALMGDTSDNIPGVPGIGEKTATNLIVTYGSLKEIQAHLSEVKPPRAQKMLTEHFDLAEMSRKLAEICVTAPLELDFEQAEFTSLYTPEAMDVLARLELKSLMKRFSDMNEGEEEPQQTVTAREITGLAEAEALLEELTQPAEDEKISAKKAAPESTEGAALAGVSIGVAPVYRIAEEAPEAGKGRKKTEPVREWAGLAVCRCGSEEAQILRADGFLTPGYLADWLNRLSEKAGWIAVLDLKAERKRLELTENGKYLDAEVASYLLNPLKSSYDIEDIAREQLDLTSPVKTPEEEARVLADAAPILIKKLSDRGMLSLFLDVEMPLIYSLDRMEKAGIRVEREALAEYGANLVGRIEALEAEIHALAGHPFNILSPKQLGEVLFDELKLPFAKKTKTGYSTNVDVMEKLKPVHPIADKILEYRTLTKLKSTYADGLAAFIGPDERIHGHFNQTITATGRISSTDPNLQNIPVRMELGRAIRKVFVPAEGCIFVDADYSQIELRILAHMSDDDKLIDAYRQAKDIHRITASQVFHVPFDEVTPELRRNAKAVNFGIVYGISAFGLSEDLSITRKEAGEYIERYFDTYPGVKAYLDRLVAQGKKEGFVTTMYGRIRPIPELSSSNFMQRQFGERVAMNSPIQGTAADIMKIAMNRVDRALTAAGLKARIILQVHDELLIEAPLEEEEQVKEILVREMEGAASLKVPLLAAVSTGKTWYETK